MCTLEINISVYMCKESRQAGENPCGLLIVAQSPVVSNFLQPWGLQHAGLPVPQHLPEFAQVHAYCIGGASQPSHPLMPSSPSPSIVLSIRDFSNEFAVHIK